MLSEPLEEAKSAVGIVSQDLLFNPEVSTK